MDKGMRGLWADGWSWLLGRVELDGSSQISGQGEWWCCYACSLLTSWWCKRKDEAGNLGLYNKHGVRMGGMFAFCVGVAMSHVPRSLDKGRRCCEYGGRVQKLELWDCAFGWYHGYHIYYSGRPLKFSDLGYSPGQPLPIFTGAYSA
jgi:hypothetical protein